MFCENELNRKKVPEIWPDKSVDWETRRLEIADILQRSEATIKTQLSRGRGLLNNTLKGEFGDAE